RTHNRSHSVGAMWRAVDRCRYRAYESAHQLRGGEGSWWAGPSRRQRVLRCRLRLRPVEELVLGGEGQDYANLLRNAAGGLMSGYDAFDEQALANMLTVDLRTHVRGLPREP